MPDTLEKDLPMALDPSDNSTLIMVGGALVTILQTAVAYFIASLHKDFKAALRTVSEHNERLAVLEFRVSQVDGQPVHKIRRNG